MLLRWMTLPSTPRSHRERFRARPIWIVITTWKQWKERHPGKSVGAAAVPVEGVGVVLTDGLTLYTGTDETWFRA